MVSKFSELLNSYKVKINEEIVRSDPILEVKPFSGDPGLTFYVSGTFERDGLENAQIFTVSFPGYDPDPVDSEIDSEQSFKIITNLLEGNYRYKLKYQSFIDRLFKGSVYISVGSEDAPILDNVKCRDQKAVKAMLAEGILVSRPYNKN